MTVSLIILLWTCSWTSGMALSTLRPSWQRVDELRLPVIIGFIFVAPGMFIVNALYFLGEWSFKLDVVIWRRDDR